MSLRRVVRSKDEVRAAIRARQDELNVTNASIENLIGLPDRYLSKVISTNPIRTLSAQTFRDIQDGLAMGIVAVVLVDDAEQEKRMRPKWAQRKRPPTNREQWCVAKEVRPVQNSFNFGE